MSATYKTNAEDLKHIDWTAPVHDSIKALNFDLFRRDVVCLINGMEGRINLLQDEEKQSLLINIMLFKRTWSIE
jgi:hypothetical protein